MYISRHLLWKDYRQAAPGLLGCWVILATLIVIRLVMHLSSPVPGTFYMAQVVLCALVAPTLAAMACSGLLFGQERQTGSWNWSSSLPIAWQSALLSKTVVWFVASLVMLGTLLSLALGSVSLLHSMGVIANISQDNMDAYSGVMAALVIPFEVYIVFNLAALLFNETLPAMVCAAAVVVAVHFSLSDIMPRVVYSIPLSNTFDLSGPGLAAIVAIIAIVGVGGGTALVKTFQWRWGVGQNTAIRLSRKTNQALIPVASPSIWQHFGLVTRQPSQLRMLLWHGFVSALALRVGIATCTLVAILLLKPLGSVLVVAAGLLGISVFSGDQPRLRFRFMADRGVNWFKLLLAHAVTPLLLTFVICLVWTLKRDWWSPQPPSNFIYVEPLQVWFLCYFVFALGICSSLCVSSQLLAVILLVGVLLISFLTILMLDGLWFYLALGSPIPLWRLLVGLIGAPLATIYLIRRWLVRGKIPTAKFLFGTALLGLVLPVCLELSTSFLLVPKVPWQGAPPSALRPIDNQTGISLPSALDALPSAEKIWPSWATESLRRNYPNWPTAARSVTQPFEVNDPKIESMLAQAKSLVDCQILLADLDKLASNLEAAAESGGKLPPNRADLIDATTFWGYLGIVQLGNPELSMAAWRINKKLNSMIDYSDIQSIELILARINSNRVRSFVTPDQWQALAEHTDLNELFNEPIPVEKLQALLKVAATYKHGYLFAQPDELAVPVRSQVALSNTFISSRLLGSFYGVDPTSRPPWANLMLKYYPPIRWNLQRQASMELNFGLQMLDQAQMEALHDTVTSFPSMPLVQQAFQEYHLKHYIERLKK